MGSLLCIKDVEKSKHMFISLWSLTTFYHNGKHVLGANYVTCIVLSVFHKVSSLSFMWSDGVSIGVILILQMSKLRYQVVK